MASSDLWYMISDYFLPDEFGTGAEDGMEDDFMISLYKFRVAIDSPMIIHPNGGYATSGHSTGSLHYEGRAVDFHFKHNPVSLRRVVVAAIKCGLHGIGIYPHWTPKPGGFHLDNRSGGRFNVWYRNEAGVYVYLFPNTLAESLEEWR